MILERSESVLERERSSSVLFIKNFVQALKSNKELSQDLRPRGKVLTPILQFRVWVKMGDCECDSCM